jgi:hypothetical protein
MRQIRVFDVKWLSSSQPHLFEELQPTSAQLPRRASVLRARYLDGSCKPCRSGVAAGSQRGCSERPESDPLQASQRRLFADSRFDRKARGLTPELDFTRRSCESLASRSTDQLENRLFGTPENFTIPARPDPTPTCWGSKGEPPQLIVLFEVFWDYVWKCKKMKFQTEPSWLKTS